MGIKFRGDSLNKDKGLRHCRETKGSLVLIKTEIQSVKNILGHVKDLGPCPQDVMRSHCSKLYAFRQITSE